MDDDQLVNANAYSDVGPRDRDVVGVVWGDPENLVAVEPETFSTFVASDNAPHGVEFFGFTDGAHFLGDADDVFGLLWLEEGKPRLAVLGSVMPTWAKDDGAT